MLKQIEFHTSETLRSFLSRTAAANGAGDMRALLKHLGTTYGKIVSCSRPADKSISAELRISAERLQRAKAVKADGSRVSVNGHVLDIKAFWRGRYRYCPMCLMNDMTAEAGNALVRPFERMSWSVARVTACHVHCVGLVTSEDFGRASDDFVRCVSSRWAVVERNAARCEAVEMNASDRYFAARLDEASAEVVFLDEVPYQAAVEICANLGCLMVLGPKTVVMADQPYAAIKRFQHAGFDFLSQGEEALRSHLTELARRYWDTAAWHPVASLFGNLYEVLNRHQEDYPSVVKIIREVVQENLPVGPEDLFLGASFERRVHTIATVARQYAIPSRTVRNMLSDAGLIDDKVRFESDGKISLGSDVLREEFEHEAHLVGFAQLVRILGLQDFADSCILIGDWEHALRPRRTRDRGDRYSMPEARRLLDRLAARAGDFRGHDMVNISDAARLALTSNDEVIQLLESGALYRVASVGNRFSGISVSYLEVRERLALPYCGALHFEDVAVALDMPVALARTLMREASLPVSTIDLRERSKAYPVIWPAALDEFQRQHVSADELAMNAEMKFEVLVASLELKGVRPSVETKSGRPVFFRRSQVARKIVVAPLQAELENVGDPHRGYTPHHS